MTSGADGERRRRGRPARALVIVLSLVWPMALVAAPADLDQIMGALAQRQHGHVTFTEEKFLKLLDRPVKSTGELLYDAPDRLEKRTLTPKPESLVLEHGVVTAQRGKHRYVLNLADYPQVVPFIESIRATLAGDRPALEKVFKVELSGEPEKWELSLAPVDPKIGRTVRLIHISGARDTIREVEILEADGDRSLLTIGPEVGK